MYYVWFIIIQGGCNIEGESERWDFGVGAGFYVDATEPKWSNNFRMFSYVNYEVHIIISKIYLKLNESLKLLFISKLHEVIKKNFTNGELKVSISGHRLV